MAHGNRQRSAISVIDTQINSSGSGSVAPDCKEIKRQIKRGEIGSTHNTSKWKAPC
ncbi:hypothetical protein Ddye_000857 [Dipteronia dyeriana]|uniref:Uncharacterized protein n=1 Tax=Dipteronia dyeriana TaxID=168575 RepID=A0AAD9XN37_9ROSI|nr:hypothetical protein Ddye_000857 [Dipteronia dyeriana]